MGRYRRVTQGEYPYHITLRTHNKVEFQMDKDELWDYICDLLLFCSYAFKIEVHAFVLMSNHYHMIVRTPEANIQKFACYFHKFISMELQRKTGRFNQQFGTRYYSSVIEDLKYYSYAYKYLYRNPIEAKICYSVQDYKYSSLQFVMGREKCRFPIYDTYFDSVHAIQPTLDWLNEQYESVLYYSIKKALRSDKFTPCI